MADDVQPNQPADVATDVITDEPLVDEGAVDAVEVEEAEVSEPEVADGRGFDAEGLTATQGLIQRLSEQLEELKLKQRELKEMLKNVFDNDEALASAEKVAEETSKTIKTRQTELNQTQQVLDIKTKLTDLSEDIKMVQESMNQHLINYFQMTGSTAIDLPNGEEREISLNARLKPTKK